MESMILLVYLIVYAVAASIIGVLASRKNRNPWAWGLIGGMPNPIIWIISLLILAGMSFLCPKCRQPLTNAQWKARNCPACKNRNSVETEVDGSGQHVAVIQG